MSVIWKKLTYSHYPYVHTFINVSIFVQLGWKKWEYISVYCLRYISWIFHQFRLNVWLIFVKELFCPNKQSFFAPERLSQFLWKILKYSNNIIEDILYRKKLDWKFIAGISRSYLKLNKFSSEISNFFKKYENQSVSHLKKVKILSFWFNLMKFEQILFASA